MTLKILSLQGGNSPNLLVPSTGMHLSERWGVFLGAGVVTLNGRQSERVHLEGAVGL